MTFTATPEALPQLHFQPLWKVFYGRRVCVSLHKADVLYTAGCWQGVTSGRFLHLGGKLWWKEVCEGLTPPVWGTDWPIFPACSLKGSSGHSLGWNFSPCPAPPRLLKQASKTLRVTTPQTSLGNWIFVSNALKRSGSCKWILAVGWPNHQLREAAGDVSWAVSAWGLTWPRVRPPRGTDCPGKHLKMWLVAETKAVSTEALLATPFREPSS